MDNIQQLFSKIQDKRKKKGKRYKLESILALIIIGYMQGFNSLAKIHRILCFDFGADKAHGRIEQRLIEVIEIEDKYFAGFPTKQIAQISKTSYNVRTKNQTEEMTIIITSLSKEKATPQELLNFTLRHWSIENKLHRTRDTIFKEDTCKISCHASHQNNVYMRNLAIFLLNKVNSSITLATEIFSRNINNGLKILFKKLKIANFV